MIAIAECGIEKYDELPGRVALIDVDGHRESLRLIRESDGSLSLLNRLRLATVYHRVHPEKIEKQILSDLEEAREIHEGETKAFYDNYFRWFWSQFVRNSERDNE